MRRLIVVRVMVSLLALGLLAGGSEIALGNVTTFHTSLTLYARKHTVKMGGDVHLFGNLSSGRHRCKANQTVEIDRGGAAVGTATTSSTGHYAFADKAPPTGTYKYEAKFTGSTFTAHGKQRACAPSHSREVSVTVKA